MQATTSFQAKLAATTAPCQTPPPTVKTPTGVAPHASGLGPGQLTEHLRRKSEQTLVAAADLRHFAEKPRRGAVREVGAVYCGDRWEHPEGR